MSVAEERDSIMTMLDDCERSMAEIDCDVAAYERGLQSIRERGVEWYMKAKRARRFKGVEHQRLQRALQRVRQDEASALSVVFVSVARDRLNPTLFAQLMEDTLDRRRNAGYKHEEKSYGEG